MRGAVCVVLGALVASAQAVVYLAGDSTMAVGGGGVPGQQGWGEYLQASLSDLVANEAIPSRSARSYTVQGHFDDIAARVVEGDFVIMEFGHNDKGVPNPDDNGKCDCPGARGETCKTTYEGESVTVLTYTTYLTYAVNNITARGASVILSSPTPTNPDASGAFSYTPDVYTTYARNVAQSTGQLFVDHGQYTANLLQTLPASTVDSYFPNQSIHTSPNGAKAVAQAFVRGLVCGPGGGLQLIVNQTEASIPGVCM